MLKKQKRRKQTITFTFFSNDANQPVKRLQLSSLTVRLSVILVVIPILVLIYFTYIGFQYRAEGRKLENSLAEQEQKSEELYVQVEKMEEEKAEVTKQMQELNQIQSQLEAYIEALPEEATGGIEVPIESQPNTDSIDLLASAKWQDNYRQTIENMDKVNDNLAYIPTAWPADTTRITSEFGTRSDPFNTMKTMHTGIDFGGPTGTPIYAGAAGIIEKASYYGGYGNAIIIKHSDTFETLYGHLSQIDVQVGDTVKKGQQIGELGNTGRSTGPHLHYEILKNGEPVDPIFYLDYFNQ